jgi:hypothetical protein
VRTEVLKAVNMTFKFLREDSGLLGYDVLVVVALLQRNVVPPSSRVKRAMKAVQFSEKSAITQPIHR